MEMWHAANKSPMKSSEENKLRITSAISLNRKTSVAPTSPNFSSARPRIIQTRKRSPCLKCSKNPQISSLKNELVSLLAPITRYKMYAINNKWKREKSSIGKMIDALSRRYHSPLRTCKDNKRI